jgi:hypothetical protein
MCQFLRYICSVLCVSGMHIVFYVQHVLRRYIVFYVSVVDVLG